MIYTLSIFIQVSKLLYYDSLINTRCSDYSEVIVHLFPSSTVVAFSFIVF